MPAGALWRAGDAHESDARPKPGGAVQPGERHEVVVVGAGITGLCTSVMLARRGRDVAVVDAAEPGSGASGANTGKVSLLQGTVLSRMRAHHPASLVRAYVESNRAGMDWLRGFAVDAGVPFTARTAYSYAASAEGMSAVDAEITAAREAGLPVRQAAPDDIGELPFPLVGAAALDDQIALDPQPVLRALAAELVSLGGTLHTGIRVSTAHAARRRVDTEVGPIGAEHIVLATGTPIADRGLTFAKTRGLRSYGVALRTDAAPDGMFLSVDVPTRSIRPVTGADGPADLAQLVVGGFGHPVGRASEALHAGALAAWARETFPDATVTHRWSAQDYESHNLVPFVGYLPRGLGRIRFATGYAKWGLTNGPAAALRLADEIAGTPRQDRAPWALALGTRMTVPADLGRGAAENARVAAVAARGWASSRDPVPVARPVEGAGTVAHRAGRPVGVSTVDGVTRAISAVCPHLGGVLAWNDADCTWDCPLHASRFAPDGTRLEGPARRDARQLSAGDGTGDGDERSAEPTASEGPSRAFSRW